MPNTIRTAVTCAALASALFGSAGCAKEFDVLRYPEFYDPGLATVAVLPFDNDTLSSQAGAFITRRIVKALRDNGTYRQVLGPEEITPVPSSATSTKPATAATQPASQPVLRQRPSELPKVPGVQAYLEGTVTRFSAGLYQEVESSPYTGGYGYYGPGYFGPYYETSTYAYGSVAIVARFVRADGTVLYASRHAILADVTSPPFPPRVPPDVSLMAAVDQAVEQLVAEIAVVEVSTKIGPGELKTARKRPNGDWDFTTSFRPGDERMYVWLKLKPEAARNEFRLAVGKKGGQDLASQPVTWRREDSAAGIGLEFSPQRLAAFAGEGEYEARFYSGDQLVYQRSFRIAAK